MGFPNFSIDRKKCVFWYGILSAVFYGLMTCIGAAGSLFFFFVLVTKANLTFLFILIGISSLAALYLGLISFFFSVLLIIGIKKNKPAFVKAHLIHRTVITVLVIGSSIAALGFFRSEYPIYWIIPALLSQYKIFTLVVMWMIYKDLTLPTPRVSNMNNQYLFIESK